MGKFSFVLNCFCRVPTSHNSTRVLNTRSDKLSHSKMVVALKISSSNRASTWKNSIPVSFIQKYSDQISGERRLTIPNQKLWRTILFMSTKFKSYRKLKLLTWTKFTNFRGICSIYHHWAFVFLWKFCIPCGVFLT